jgi:RNA polymerase sigma-70 factor (ECF subfamily)
MTEKQSRNKNDAAQRFDNANVDVDLGALARTNDRDNFEKEWEKFFEGFHARLMDFFSPAVPDWDERDELVQDVFIRAYRAIAISGHALRSNAAGWSWLTTIGKNLLRDKRAKVKTASAMMERYARDAAVEAELREKADVVMAALALEDEADLVGRRIDQAGFEYRLSQLSDDERRILQMRFVEGLEWSEVAENEGRNSTAIRKQFSRLGRFLRGADD